MRGAPFQPGEHATVMKPAPYRVLHVLGGMQMGGAETLVMNVFRHIDRRLVQFDFAVAAAGRCHFDEEIEALGGRIYRHPAPQFHLMGFNRAFTKILRSRGPFAAVHSHVHSFSGNVLRLAHQAWVPVRIAHSHCSGDGKGDSLPRIIYRAVTRQMIQEHATHLVCASLAAGESLFGRDLRPGRQIRALPNGMDLRPYAAGPDRQAVRNELGIAAGACLIAHVGRFDAGKNQRFAVEVFREVATRKPDAHLVFAGAGPLQPGVREHAERLAVAGNTHFLGMRTDVPAILAAADVFLFPSLSEGLGNVLIEAQASGLHCIVSDAVPPEADLELGLMHRLGLDVSPHKWADLICDVMALPRPSWPVRRSALIEKQFDIESLARVWGDLYQDCEPSLS